MPAKVVLLGLDSASATLVRRWTDLGELPHLGELRRRGGWGALTSPPGLGDDAAWGSFSTCSDPGRHGRFHFRSILPGSYDYRPARDTPLRREPFWTTLGRRGLRTAVVDVPKCPLTPEVNGLHLADWSVHGRDGPTRSAPGELAPEILRKYGDDRTDRPGTPDWLCHLEALPESRLGALAALLLDSIERKTRLAEDLLDRECWDLFLLVFKEAHCAGHQFWHLADPAHPAHSAELAERLAHPLLRVYRALDAAIGRLLAHVGPEAHVLVFSDLDMGANYTAEHLLDDILRRLEHRLWRGRSWLTHWRDPAARLYGRTLQPLTGRRLKGVWLRGHRRVFQVDHNEISGAIRLNLKGREADGIVAPGDEAEAVLAALTAELLQLVNPATGGPLVADVLRSDRLFPGEGRDMLPDLLVVWRRDAPIAAAESPLLGRLPPRIANYRTGNHLADGFCLGRGRHQSGRGAFTASIADLGPTVATLLGTQLDGVDGRPIPALVH